MTVGSICQRCDGKSSRAARYCQWCGLQLRELEDFESPNVPNHALVPFAELREELRPDPTEYRSRSWGWPQ